jgi:cell division septation protein DedD
VTQLRSKVVCGIVLIALLVIFVPLFLKGAHAQLTLHAMPNLPSVPSSDHFGLELHDTHPLKNSFTLPLAPAKAWVLQLADVKESSVAKALIQTLRQKGFKAYARQMILPSGLATRVFVGPEISMDDIKMLKIQLTKKMSLKSTIIIFDPLLL